MRKSKVYDIMNVNGNPNGEAVKMKLLKLDNDEFSAAKRRKPFRIV